MHTTYFETYNLLTRMYSSRILFVNSVGTSPCNFHHHFEVNMRKQNVIYLSGMSSRMYSSRILFVNSVGT
jgi:hypothetical protein